MGCESGGSSGRRAQHHWVLKVRQRGGGGATGVQMQTDQGTAGS